MLLCVPVFMLDRTLCNVFGSLRNVFGHLQILSDPTKNLGTLKIKKCHAYKCKKVGRYTRTQILVHMWGPRTMISALFRRRI